MSLEKIQQEEDQKNNFADEILKQTLLQEVNQLHKAFLFQRAKLEKELEKEKKQKEKEKKQKKIDELDNDIFQLYKRYNIRLLDLGHYDEEIKKRERYDMGNEDKRIGGKKKYNKTKSKRTKTKSKRTKTNKTNSKRK